MRVNLALTRFFVVQALSSRKETRGKVVLNVVVITAILIHSTVVLIHSIALIRTRLKALYIKKMIIVTSRVRSGHCLNIDRTLQEVEVII